MWFTVVEDNLCTWVRVHAVLERVHHQYNDPETRSKLKNKTLTKPRRLLGPNRERVSERERERERERENIDL